MLKNSNRKIQPINYCIKNTLTRALTKRHIHEEKKHWEGGVKMKLTKEENKIILYSIVKYLLFHLFLFLSSFWWVDGFLAYFLIFYSIFTIQIEKNFPIQCAFSICVHCMSVCTRCRRHISCCMKRKIGRMHTAQLFFLLAAANWNGRPVELIMVWPWTQGYSTTCGTSFSNILRFFLSFNYSIGLLAMLPATVYRF